MIEVELSAIGSRDLSLGIHGRGWIRDALDPRDLLYAARPETLANLPPSVDLGPWPEIYDQGQTGSCTANAGAAIFDYQRGKQGYPFMAPSRLFLYYAERIIESSTESDAGAQIRDVIKALATYGVCEESVWPFDESKVTTRPPQQDFTRALEDMVVRYRSVSQTAEQIMGCLAEGFPIEFGFLLYKGYETLLGPSSIVPLPLPHEQPLGGHANVLRGYKTENGQVLVRARNSWSNRWGDSGECWFPMSYLTNQQVCADLWAVELVRDLTVVPPLPPPFYVGPGIKKAMDARGDMPASAEWYPLDEHGQNRGFSMAFGRTGVQYIYVVALDKVTVTMPGAVA